MYEQEERQGASMYEERNSIYDRYRERQEEEEAEREAAEYDALFEEENAEPKAEDLDLNGMGPSHDAVRRLYNEIQEEKQAREHLNNVERKSVIMSKHFERNPHYAAKGPEIIETADREFAAEGLPGFKSHGAIVVKAQLEQIARTNPALARSLDNPKGWRRLWEETFTRFGSEVQKTYRDLKREDD